MKKFNLKILFIFYFLFLFINVYAEQKKQWTLTSLKFSLSKKTDSNISKGVSELLPQKILSYFTNSKYRNIQDDEKIQRQLYELKNKRIALFLQLSSQIKTRDALVVSVIDDKELKKQIATNEQKIEELKKQIDENLEQQKQVLDGVLIQEEQYTDILSKKFIQPNEKEINSSEQIVVLNNDATFLYEPLINKEKLDFTSYEFEKELTQNNINCLITGNVNIYLEYFTVQVHIYNYPGAKKIISLTEYGNINDLDDVAKNIFLQIKDKILNNNPCNIKIKGLSQNAKFYLDNELQENMEEIKIESGVHKIEFIQEGFTTAQTNYYFEPNKDYEINVNLKEENQTKAKIKIEPFIEGSFYANSILLSKTQEDDYEIMINGEKILSQFISSDGNSFFFYIKPNPLEDITKYSIKIKNTSTSDYIEKRRRWMYTSYSIFVCSLFPKFYTQGKVNSYTQAYNAGTLTSNEDLLKANQWIQASNVTTGITIGAGVFFMYELVRYLYSANSVLPHQAKIINEDD